MTPRTSIVAIPEGLLAAEAAHVCLQSGYSRYPVYRGSLDEVIGVTHAFDLLRLPPDAPVPVLPALVVPGTTRAADLMLDMQRGQSHLAVDRKSTRLNSSHVAISYAVFCLKKKIKYSSSK